jgi:cytochrome c oxidase subunit 4
MSAHVLPKSTYYAIFFSLMVLTAATVGVAFVNLGALNFPVAIAIAITKATLVVLFFMHVKYSSRLTKMVVAIAIFFLLILLGLTMTDYLTRDWGASPRGNTGAGVSDTLEGGGRLAPSGGSRSITPAPSSAPAPGQQTPAEPAAAPAH